MLYARGVFINRCYDELNLSQPELIREIHAEYLQAGAEVIETNTFGGNAFRLETHGLKDKVREINIAGVRLARECVNQIRDKQASEAFVAGAIGPLGVRLEPLGKIGLDEARAAFAEQIRALVEGGPGVGADLLIIETMTSLAEAEQAILAAKSVAPEAPVVVMMTVDEEGNCLDGSSAETAAIKLTQWGADAVGCNCSSGPATVLSVIERMRVVTDKPLAAMPNAGIPRAVEGRTIYLTSPEYMASFTRKIVKAGASIVGGCCGTTPNYTRAMKSYLRAMEAMDDGAQKIEHADSNKAAVKAASKVEPPILAQRSKIGAMVAAGEFVTMVEIVPPKGIDCSKELDGAEMLHRLGVDAIFASPAIRRSSATIPTPLRSSTSMQSVW
jgi:homocysteine S-methyltransferase